MEGRSKGLTTPAVVSQPQQWWWVDLSTSRLSSSNPQQSTGAPRSVFRWCKLMSAGIAAPTDAIEVSVVSGGSGLTLLPS